ASEPVIIGVCIYTKSRSLKNVWTAKASALRILKMALKVPVRKRRCAISRKNSKLCFFGCNGYFSGSESPRIVSSLTLISTRCPFPRDSTSCPFTCTAAPVVIRFNKASSVFSKSTTACILLIDEPSLIAINWLFRKVLTQPFTITSLPNSSVFNNSFIRVCFIFIIVLLYSPFFLIKKETKNQGLVCFRYLYLSIPKQNGTRFAQTTFCF